MSPGVSRWTAAKAGVLVVVLLSIGNAWYSSGLFLRCTLKHPFLSTTNPENKASASASKSAPRLNLSAKKNAGSAIQWQSQARTNASAKPKVLINGSMSTGTWRFSKVRIKDWSLPQDVNGVLPSCDHEQVNILETLFTQRDDFEINVPRQCISHPTEPADSRHHKNLEKCWAPLEGVSTEKRKQSLVGMLQAWSNAATSVIEFWPWGGTLLGATRELKTSVNYDEGASYRSALADYNSTVPDMDVGLRYTVAEHMWCAFARQYPPSTLKERGYSVAAGFGPGSRFIFNMALVPYGNADVIGRLIDTTNGVYIDIMPFYDPAQLRSLRGNEHVPDMYRHHIPGKVALDHLVSIQPWGKPGCGDVSHRDLFPLVHCLFEDIALTCPAHTSALVTRCYGPDVIATPKSSTETEWRPLRRLKDKVVQNFLPPGPADFDSDPRARMLPTCESEAVNRLETYLTQQDAFLVDAPRQCVQRDEGVHIQTGHLEDCWVPNHNITNEERKMSVVAILQELTDLFHGHLEFWPWGGTLLGSTQERGNSFLPFDDDGDIGMTYSNLLLLWCTLARHYPYPTLHGRNYAVEVQFKQHFRFHMAPIPYGNVDVVARAIDTRTGAYVDVMPFFTQRQLQTLLDSPFVRDDYKSPIPADLTELGEALFVVMPWDPFQCAVLPLRELYPLRACLFEQVSLRCPAQTKTLLQRCYGDGWVRSDRRMDGSRIGDGRDVDIPMVDDTQLPANDAHETRSDLASTTDLTDIDHEDIFQ